MKCPICKKPVDDAEADKPKTLYPFCSDRCKLIDLGRWLDGTYALTAKAQDADPIADGSSSEE